MQRKDEHADFEAQKANDGAVIQLIEVAKNRLNKFYNPKLYKPPPKRQLSEEEQITVNMGGTLAPEANLAYKKSGEESGGVIAMIDLLVADIDKENQIMEVDEKDAQKDYETFMSDASAKRAEDSKAITDKESAQAE